jgi:hypothetical protein
LIVFDGIATIILLSTHPSTVIITLLFNKRAAPTLAKAIVPALNIFALSLVAVSAEILLEESINPPARSATLKKFIVKNKVLF